MACGFPPRRLFFPQDPRRVPRNSVKKQKRAPPKRGSRLYQSGGGDANSGAFPPSNQHVVSKPFAFGPPAGVHSGLSNPRSNADDRARSLFGRRIDRMIGALPSDDDYDDGPRETFDSGYTSDELDAIFCRARGGVGIRQPRRAFPLRPHARFDGWRCGRDHRAKHGDADYGARGDGSPRRRGVGPVAERHEPLRCR